MPSNPRQLAFKALQRIQKGAFADIALNQVFQASELDQRDRRFVTELVYGSIRQQRTLDALIEQFSTQKKRRHPVNLQLILRLGFYQLRYLSHIPAAAAVNTTVDLAKENGLRGLTGFVNGILRQYLRMSRTSGSGPNTRFEIAPNASSSMRANPSPEVTVDPLKLPDNPTTQLGIRYSYPDWIVELWLQELGIDEATQLCQWFNRTPSIDLRVNSQRASVQDVKAAFQSAGITCQSIHGLPHTLRLLERPGLIQALPGFEEGWWTIQDASAQLVGYLLDPQPGELIIDACAAPGGKTTHIAELMGDIGQVWACDRHASRLKKITENSHRLRLTSITSHVRDCSLSDAEIVTASIDGSKATESSVTSKSSQWNAIADRVLVDAPCSGLGTLHRHADARWRQTPHHGTELSHLQSQLLKQTAQWVKPGGILVYSTCTLNPIENEAVIQTFLECSQEWSIEQPSTPSFLTPFTQPQGWLTLWPHITNMDGFFMVRLKRS